MPHSARGGSAVKPLMVGAVPLTVRVAEVAAAAKLPLAAWLAVMVDTPAPTMLIRLPLTVATAVLLLL